MCQKCVFEPVSFLFYFYFFLPVSFLVRLLEMGLRRGKVWSEIQHQARQSRLRGRVTLDLEVILPPRTVT